MPNNLTIQIAVAGGAAAKTAFNDIGRAVREASDKINSAHKGAAESTGLLSRAFAALGGDVEAAEHAVGPAVLAINRFSGAFEGLRGVVAALAPEMRAFTEVGIGVGALLLARSAANATVALQNQADAVGVGREELEGYRNAAVQTGGSVEALDGFLGRFSSALGKAKDAVEQINEKSDIYNQTLQTSGSRFRLMGDEAEASVSRATNAIARQQGAIAAAALATTRAQEAYDRLSVSHMTIAERAVPIGTQANDKQLIEIQKLDNAQTSLRLTQERAKEAQASLADAYRTANIAIERQRQVSQEASLAQDKLIRADLDARRKAAGAFGKLGLDPTQYKTTGEALAAFTEKLNSLNDATLRASILREIAGRGWVESSKFLQLSAADLEKYRQQVIGVNDEEVQFATVFRGAWSRMTQAFEGLSNIVGNQLGRVFVPIFEAVSDFLKNNEEGVREFASAFSDVLAPAVKGLFDVIRAGAGLLAAYFRPLIETFEEGVKTLNEMLGTKFTGADIIVGAALGAAAFRILLGSMNLVTAALGLMIGPISNLIGFVRLLAGGFGALGVATLPLTLLIGLVTALGAAIFLLYGDTSGLSGLIQKVFGQDAAAAFDAFVNRFRGAKDEFIATWNGTIQGLQEIWNNGLQLIADTWKTAVVDPIVHGFDLMIYWADYLIGLIEKGIKAAGELLGLSSSASAGSTGTQTFSAAGGGAVPGHGTGDTVPAMLTPGEHVMNLQAVGRYGRAFFDNLNAGHFSLGGAVRRISGASDQPALAFASGGEVGEVQGLLGQTHGLITNTPNAYVAVNLGYNGRNFPVMASHQVASALVQHSQAEQAVQIAAKPSWYGGGRGTG